MWGSTEEHKGELNTIFFALQILLKNHNMVAPQLHLIPPGNGFACVGLNDIWFIMKKCTNRGGVEQNARKGEGDKQKRMNESGDVQRNTIFFCSADTFMAERSTITIFESL